MNGSLRIKKGLVSDTKRSPTWPEEIWQLTGQTTARQIASGEGGQHEVNFVRVDSLHCHISGELSLLVFGLYLVTMLNWVHEKLVLSDGASSI